MLDFNISLPNYLIMPRCSAVMAMIRTDGGGRTDGQRRCGGGRTDRGGGLATNTVSVWSLTDRIHANKGEK